MPIIVGSSSSYCSTSQIKTLKVKTAHVRVCLGQNANIVSIVQEGDRIAQLILEKIHTPEVLEVKVSPLLYHHINYIPDGDFRIWTRRFVDQVALDPLGGMRDFDLNHIPPLKHKSVSSLLESKIEQG